MQEEVNSCIGVRSLMRDPARLLCEDGEVPAPRRQENAEGMEDRVVDFSCASGAYVALGLPDAPAFAMPADEYPRPADRGSPRSAKKVALQSPSASPGGRPRF